MSVSLRQLPKKVLVVTKVTRFESVSKRFGGKRGTELIQELRARGLPHERIRTSHETHHAALDKIVDGLRKSWRCDVAVVSALSLVPSQFDGVDAVFTAGGDGTVLETALHIHSNMLPVVTVNTDPILSTGFLCGYKLQADGCFVEGFLDKLRNLQFEWQFRSRIQIMLGANKKLPNLALNEVFFAEADPSRPTVHETFLLRPDGSVNESYVQRSSGVIVSTGTGSTAWMSSASMVPKPDVQRILEAGGLHCDDHRLDEICERVNNDCVDDVESRRLQYFVREPVMNGWYGRHDEPLSATPRRGFLEAIKLRSLGWGDVTVTLDGLSTCTIPYGETLHIGLAPPELSLRTVRLHEE